MKPALTDSRCGWCGTDPLYVRYHDNEWGQPTYDRQALFERLSLEAMQAGLSWLTVLRKREHMQEVFFDFEISRLARCGKRELNRWLKDPGLIRHRGKLEALVHNARCVEALLDSLSALKTDLSLPVKVGKQRKSADPFTAVLWSAVDGQPQVNGWRSLEEVPATTPAAEALSKTLKQLGFKFVGPTMCYALMQSAGMVNDHLLSCAWHPDHADHGSRP